VLFLDELPEFNPSALDSLRQPLETGAVAIARVHNRVTYPARFQLVAAMNPCRCGHANTPGYACKRQPNERCIAQYQARISGPLLDRIDLHLDVQAVSTADLLLPAPVEGSAESAARVARARRVQDLRGQRLGLESGSVNATIAAAMMDEWVQLDPVAASLVRDAADKLRLTARGFHRVLKLARTIADLQGEGAVLRPHIAEALAYRPRQVQ